MSDIYLQITETPTVVTLSAPVVSGALASTVTVANTVTVALDSNSLTALENVTVTVGAAVTISNFPATQAVSLASVPTHGVTLASTTVTVSSLPAISGTVTATNISSLPDIGGNSVIRSFVFGYDYTEDVPVAVAIDNNDQSLLISGTVNAIIGSSIPAGTNRIGVVTIGGGTVTIGAGTAQIGSVTASISGTVPVSGTFWPETQPVSLAATTVTISANPAGPLTTRFGSVTTANTSQLTAAVTNTAREYLFIQNISTGIVTVGIGFPSTTTQGIQLSPGSGMTFDSFCPTGAVWWLGATTGATWTILEG
jgi:hypothetical protein